MPSPLSARGWGKFIRPRDESNLFGNDSAHTLRHCIGSVNYRIIACALSTTTASIVTERPPQSLVFAWTARYD
jgi:hypothetical protein